MTFFGPSMTEKTVVEARARKIVPDYGGWSGQSDALRDCVSLSYTSVHGCVVLGAN